MPKKLKHHHRNQLQRTTSRYVSLDSKVKAIIQVTCFRRCLSPEASSKKVLPKSSTTSLLDGDNKRMNFTDEMEETEENSLRVAIIENIFKMVGIEETNGIVERTGYFQSLSSSTSSSIVGLDSLNQSIMSGATTPTTKRSHPVFNNQGSLMNTINLAELRKPSTAENSTLPKLSGKKRLLST